jgi:hypothetical protein
VRISVTIPDVRAPRAVSNLLGLVGLLGVVVSVGALAGSWWWSTLVGSVVCVALAWVAHTHAEADAARQAGPAGVDGPTRAPA